MEHSIEHSIEHAIAGEYRDDDEFVEPSARSIEDSIEHSIEHSTEHAIAGEYRDDDEFLELSARRIERIQQICFDEGRARLFFFDIPAYADGDRRRPVST